MKSWIKFYPSDYSQSLATESSLHNNGTYVHAPVGTRPDYYLMNFVLNALAVNKKIIFIVNEKNKLKETFNKFNETMPFANFSFDFLNLDDLSVAAMFKKFHETQKAKQFETTVTSFKKFNYENLDKLLWTINKHENMSYGTAKLTTWDYDHINPSKNFFALMTRAPFSEKELEIMTEPDSMRKDWLKQEKNLKAWAEKMKFGLNIDVLKKYIKDPDADKLKGFFFFGKYSTPVLKGLKTQEQIDIKLSKEHNRKETELEEFIRYFTTSVLPKFETYELFDFDKYDDPRIVSLIEEVVRLKIDRNKFAIYYKNNSTYKEIKENYYQISPYVDELNKILFHGNVSLNSTLNASVLKNNREFIRQELIRKQKRTLDTNKIKIEDFLNGLEDVYALKNPVERIEKIILFFKKNFNFIFSIYPVLIMTPDQADMLNIQKIKSDYMVFTDSSRIKFIDVINILGVANHVIGIEKVYQPGPKKILKSSDSYNDFSVSQYIEAKKFPKVDLKFNYRTDHVELFNFANKNLFSDKIVSFSSPVSWNKPIKLVFAKEGSHTKFSDINKQEAAAIFAEIKKTSIKNTDITILTATIGQKIYIKNLLYNDPINFDFDISVFSIDEELPKDRYDYVLFSLVYDAKTIDKEWNDLPQIVDLTKAISVATSTFVMFSSLKSTSIKESKNKTIMYIKKMLEYTQTESSSKQTLIARSNKPSSNLVKDIYNSFEHALGSAYTFTTNFNANSLHLDLIIFKNGVPRVIINCNTNLNDIASFVDEYIAFNYIELPNYLYEKKFKFFNIWPSEWIIEKDEIIKKVKEYLKLL